MTSYMRLRLMTCTLFLAVLLTSILSSAEGSSWLVDRAAVRGYDVKILWQYNIPFRYSETVQQMLIDGDRLYVLSRQNYLTCLNRHTGEVILSSYIANPGLPNTGLVIYQGELMTTVGKRIVEINRRFGTQAESTEAVYGIVCPPARNDSYVYVAGADNRLHALRIDNKVEAFEAAAENDSRIISVVADANRVVFGTDQGNVISIGAERPRFIWQFDVHGQVADALLSYEDSIYVASANTYVHRILTDNGRLVWKQRTEAVLTTAPLVTERAVYQYVDNSGLLSLDRETGSPRWKVAGGRGLLTEDGDTVYVLTLGGWVTAVDDPGGKQLYSVSLGDAFCFVSNLADSAMYVSDRFGRVAALAPKR